MPTAHVFSQYPLRVPRDIVQLFMATLKMTARVSERLRIFPRGQVGYYILYEYNTKNLDEKLLAI